ncbi:unnamed protein product [Dovyalis caffra]|uniref:Uncharacterized protein n=1 Tax=Dovyalis caffra TaxID=77055 RepID=A0AAV1R143_9ROSI|nr:unnamed protein product [Dovyalis caffra]
MSIQNFRELQLAVATQKAKALLLPPNIFLFCVRRIRGDLSVKVVSAQITKCLRQMTEAKKRKQDELNDDVPDAETKAREDKEGQTAEVTNAEVDEFYAILKRIHVAVKYFKEANEDGHKLTQARSLEREFEVEASGVKVNGVKREEEGVEENEGFDLNVDPEPEEEGLA